MINYKEDASNCEYFLKYPYAFNPEENGYYDEFNTFYLSTTESIALYLPLLDVKDKSVLTVCGSGDQALDMSLQGTKNITIFDINKSALYYFYLKIAAIKSLTFNEFTDCIIKGYPKYYYEMIKDNIPITVRGFFDYIYYKCLAQDLSSYCYGITHIRSSEIDNKESYMTPNNYLELQNNIDNYNFEIIRSDVRTLLDHVKSTYDIINLSNIMDHLCLNSYRCPPKLFKVLIEKGIIPLLNEEGKLLCAYLYRDSVHEKRRNQFWGHRHFKSEGYEFDKLNNGDHVLIYKK